MEINEVDERDELARVHLYRETEEFCCIVFGIEIWLATRCREVLCW
jgi:hypothetical protein